MKKTILAIATALIFVSCCSENTNTEQASASLASLTGIPYSKTTINKKDAKRVLVVSSSPRCGGNTDLLADEFAKGATEAGAVVEKVFLADYDLTFLSESGANKPKDESHDTDAWKLTEAFLNADVVCLASPTYYMNVNDRMKAFIDATYLAFSDERMGGKEYYYITACAQSNTEVAEWCFNGMRGFVMCLPSATERGYVRAIGMGRAGAVSGTQYMTEAYELGKNINN